MAGELPADLVADLAALPAAELAVVLADFTVAERDAILHALGRTMPAASTSSRSAWMAELQAEAAAVIAGRDSPRLTSAAAAALVDPAQATRGEEAPRRSGSGPSLLSGLAQVLPRRGAR